MADARIRFDHESEEFERIARRFRQAVDDAEMLDAGLMGGRIPGERFEALVGRVLRELEDAGAELRAHLRGTFKDVRWERPSCIEPTKDKGRRTVEGRLFVLRTRNFPGSR